jgi:hypothetical protein
MIKPTVGRVVYFRPDSHDPIERNGTEPLAAIVTRAWSDTCLNLMVMDVHGVACSRTSVMLVQPDEPKPEHSFCHWMPFQVGQAQALDKVAQANADFSATVDAAKT